MKNLLFIGLLICSLSSKGQVIDTIVKANSDTTLIKYDSEPYGNIDKMPFEYGLKRSDSVNLFLPINYGAEMKDTIPIIMLVSSNGMDKEGFSYYLKGYAERTLVYGSIPSGNSDGFLTYPVNRMGWTPVSETYLDADKKHLSKNIIVWISKEIN